MKLLTRQIVEQAVDAGDLPAPEADERTRFWFGLNPEKLKAETDQRLAAAEADR